MSDTDRIARKAHELWEAEGQPHGRDQAHWEQAREIIALEDSAGVARLPRETGAEPPVENKAVAVDNEGQAPGLTDTGEHDLTSTTREPTFAAPKKAAAKKAAMPAADSKTSKVVAPKKARAAAKAK